MKKLFTGLFFLPLLTIALTGCGEKQYTMEDAVKEFIGSDESLDDINFDYSVDPEEIYDELESLDLPATFPVEFVYEPSKITSVSDAGSEGESINYYIGLSTTDEYKDVKSFYQAMFKNNSEWDVTYETTEQGYYNLDVDQETETYVKTLYISIYEDYNSLTAVDLNYYYAEF